MSRREKLLARLRSRPTDFSWTDLQRLMEQLGFEELCGSGSRRKFVSKSSRRIVSLHRRHPDGNLLPYQIRDILDFLRQEGLI